MGSWGADIFGFIRPAQFTPCHRPRLAHPSYSPIIPPIPPSTNGRLNIFPLQHPRPRRHPSILSLIFVALIVPYSFIAFYSLARSFLQFAPLVDLPVSLILPCHNHHDCSSPHPGLLELVSRPPSRRKNARKKFVESILGKFEGGWKEELAQRLIEREEKPHERSSERFPATSAASDFSANNQAVSL